MPSLCVVKKKMSAQSNTRDVCRKGRERKNLAKVMTEEQISQKACVKREDLFFYLKKLDEEFRSKIGT